MQKSIPHWPTPTQRTLFYLSILLFRASLDVMYVVFVHPVFGYTGFDLDFQLGTYIESWLLVLVPCIFLSATLRKPSDFFVLALMLGLIVPMTSLHGLADRPRLVIYIVILGFALLCVSRLGRVIRIPTVRHGSFYALLLSALLTVVVLLWLGLSGGFSFLNFSFYRVYDLRETVGDVISQGWFSYINLWVFKVLNIFLFTYALHRRAWLIAIAIFALQVIFFGISAHKGVLFYPFMILAIWYYLRRSRALVAVPLGMFAIVILCGVVWWLADLALLGSLFVRRVFFATSNNAYDYFEFFSTNEFVYWSNSLTSAVVDYPYHLSPPELIGEWQGGLSYVNNSFIANGYMHAGLIGLLSYCIVVGFLFRIIDSLAARGVATWIGLAVTVVPVWSLLLSADLPTALMTHGLGMAVFLLFLLRGRSMESMPSTRGWNSTLVSAQPNR